MEVFLKVNFNIQKFGFFSLILFFVYPNILFAVGSIGVKPMVIDLELSPNSKGDFKIEVFSTTKEEASVHVSIFDTIQKEDGSLEFVEVGKNPFSCAKWIKLDKTDFIVSGEDTVYVNGEIFVPRTASGMRIATLMIEPGYEKKPTGITVKIRYAVVLRLKIKGKPVIEKARLENFGIKQLDDGTPTLEVLLFNNSEIDYFVKGKIIVQDSSGKILNNLNLTTDSLERKKIDMGKKAPKSIDEEGQKLYPGSKVVFWSRIDKFLPEGEYNAIVNIKYGKKTLTKKGKFVISKEMVEHFKENKLTSFEIQPEKVEIKIARGGKRISNFKIINHSSRTLNLKIYLNDISFNKNGEKILKEKGTTSYSLADYFSLEKEDYSIEPGKVQTIQYMLNIPTSAPPGGRYGTLVIENLADKSQKKYFGLVVLTQDKIQTGIDLRNVSILNEDNDKQIISLELKNISPIHLTPSGKITLKDSNQIRIASIELKFDGDFLLPETIGILKGDLKKKLVKGKYFLTAEVYYEDKKSVTKDFELEVN